MHAGSLLVGLLARSSAVGRGARLCVACTLLSRALGWCRWRGGSIGSISGRQRFAVHDPVQMLGVKQVEKGPGARVDVRVCLAQAQREGRRP